MQDLKAPTDSDDGSADGTALMRHYEKWIELGKIRGYPFCTEPPNYKRYMEEVGFVDVREEIKIWPNGPWMEDEKMKTLGLWTRANQLNVWDGFQRAGKFPPGTTKEQLDAEIEAVKKDLVDPNIHSYMKL